MDLITKQQRHGCNQHSAVGCGNRRQGDARYLYRRRTKRSSEALGQLLVILYKLKILYSYN